MAFYQIKEKGLAGEWYLPAINPVEALDNYLLFNPEANPNDVQIIKVKDEETKK